MFSSDLKSQLVETSETTFLWSSLHQAGAFREERGDGTHRKYGRDGRTGNTGSYIWMRSSPQRAPNSKRDPRQTAGDAWCHLRVSWNCNTTGSRTELKRAAAALLRQSQQQQQQQQKGLKKQQRQRGRPTETGNVLLRQRRRVRRRERPQPKRLAAFVWLSGAALVH